LVAAGGEEVTRRYYVLAVAILLASVSIPQAQTAVPTVEVNKPYTVGWDWTGDQTDLTGFKLEVGGVQVGADIAPTLRQAVVPAPTACGTVAVRIGAFNIGGTSWSAPLQVKVIGCPPAAPTGLRIIGSSLP
jgi:hypothetical protein